MDQFNFDNCQFITKEKDALLRKGKLKRSSQYIPFMTPKETQTKALKTTYFKITDSNFLNRQTLTPDSK